MLCESVQVCVCVCVCVCVANGIGNDEKHGEQSRCACEGGR